MNDTRPRNHSGRLRIRVGLSIVILGLVIFVFGANPALFNADRSPVTGFVQIAVFLIGLALICLGGYTALNALWNGNQKTILGDIGLRLVSTGYVISVASGMADVFGFGSQTAPAIPYFGPVQAIGVMIGVAVIFVGFLLLIPFPSRSKQHKSPG
jgi:hypothetical protein